MFHDIANLDDVVATHEVVDPGKPGVLCSAEVSTLLYVDTSKSPHEVCWLDCTTSPPKPAADKQPIHLQPDVEVNGMCWVNSDGKQFVVYAPNTGGIFAYNTALNRIEWDFKEIPTSIKNNSKNGIMNVRGLTTDGSGFIFVSDYDNESVLMLTTDGVYMGTVLDLKDVGGKPGTLCWCESLSSLVVAYEKDKKWAIVTVKLGNVF